jgi:hypothetical protein
MNRIPSTVAVALVSSIALLPIILVALLLRGIRLAVSSLARAIEPSFVSWRDLMAFDPILGWKPRPNLRASYCADYDDVFQLVTDAEGWPGPGSVEEAHIVAIGDSFAFGYGVDSHRAFFSLDTSLRVKAVGAPGYSMVHGVRLMEQFGARLRGKHVLWMVFPENDLQDNLVPNMRHYRAPFLRLCENGTDWEIASGHITPEPWTASLTTSRAEMLAAFCVPGLIADRAYSACDWLLHRAHTICQDHDAKLAVITVPHRALLTAKGCSELATLSPSPEEFDPSLPDQRIGDACNTLRIPFLSGREIFQYADYKHREKIHWNSRGHRRMAKLLKRFVQEASVAPPLRVDAQPQRD